MRYVMVAVVLLLSVIGNAQQSIENEKRQLVTLSLPETTVKAEIRKKPAKIEANDALTYHWYKSNKILSTQGGYEGKLLDGKYTSFYLNKNLKEQGRFELGLKDGEWKRWHQNGRLQESAFYTDGQLNGRARSYNDEGELMAEAHFRSGVKHGKETLYKAGKVDKVEHFRHGKVEGPKKKMFGWLKPGKLFKKKAKQPKIEPIPPTTEEPTENKENKSGEKEPRTKKKKPRAKAARAPKTKNKPKKATAEPAKESDSPEKK